MAVVSGVVVIPAGELHEDARLVAYGPRVMTWRQKHDVVLREILLGTVIHHDPERSRKDESHMWQSTTIGSGVVFQII